MHVKRTQLLCILVMAYIDMGLHSNALVHATEAIQAARRSGDLSLMSWALNRAGLTYEALGDTLRGEELLNEALQIAREVSGDEELFSALNNLADLLLTSSDSASGEERTAIIGRAISFANEAMALACEAGNSHRETVCIGNLVSANVKLGQFDAALSQLSRLQAIALREGYRAVMLHALAQRGMLEASRKDYGSAIEFYELALASAHEADNASALPSLRLGLYKSYKLNGDYAEALKDHEELLELERARLKQRADRQVRLLQNRIEVQQAQTVAERAHLNAEVQRLHSLQLESENEKLTAEVFHLEKSAYEDHLTGLANRRKRPAAAS